MCLKLNLNLRIKKQGSPSLRQKVSRQRLSTHTSYSKWKCVYKCHKLFLFPLSSSNKLIKTAGLFHSTEEDAGSPHHTPAEFLPDLCLTRTYALIMGHVHEEKCQGTRCRETAVTSAWKQHCWAVRVCTEMIVFKIMLPASVANGAGCLLVDEFWGHLPWLCLFLDGLL